MSSDKQPALPDRKSIRKHQLKTLHKMLDEINEKNEFWMSRFSEAGLNPNEIQSWEDFQSIPLLEKQKLVNDQNDNPPYGTNLTYSIDQYSRLHQTSGTTGNPLCWLDTPASWNWFMDCWELIYSLVGLKPEDRIAFPFSFGPFIGFWAAA